MANRVSFPGDVHIAENLTVSGTMPTTARSGLIQDTLQKYPIPWTFWRVWDAYHTNLPGTAATDDLALIGGTFATGSPSIQTEDLKAAGATNKYARAQIWLPPEYDNGQTMLLRFHAGMLTTVADTTATIDLECYKLDEEAGIGSDLCATAATTINSLTLADIDFTITPTGLVSGDMFDLRINLAINDAATGTAVQGILGAAHLLIDIKG